MPLVMDSHLGLASTEMSCHDAGLQLPSQTERFCVFCVQFSQG